MSGFVVFQRLQGSCEGKTALPKSSFQTSHKLTAKNFRQNSYWQEEVISRTDPLTAVGGQSTGGNHTMEMGMMQQVLAPSMEDREKTDFRAQMFGVGGDLDEGICAGAEYEVIEQLLVLQHE